MKCRLIITPQGDGIRLTKSRFEISGDMTVAYFTRRHLVSKITPSIQAGDAISLMMATEDGPIMMHGAASIQQMHAEHADASGIARCWLVKEASFGR